MKSYTASKAVGLEVPLTTSQVAALFLVAPQTVTRWADGGHLSSFRTPGGHRRFPAREVHALRARNFTPSSG